MTYRGNLSECHKNHRQFPCKPISELRGMCRDVCKYAYPRGHFGKPVADIRMFSSIASPPYYLKQGLRSLLLYVCMHCHNTHEEMREQLWGSWFSPSTRWVLGTELVSLSLGAGSFPTELPCHTSTLVFETGSLTTIPSFSHGGRQPALRSSCLRSKSFTHLASCPAIRWVCEDDSTYSK